MASYSPGTLWAIPIISAYILSLALGIVGAKGCLQFFAAALAGFMAACVGNSLEQTHQAPLGGDYVGTPLACMAVVVAGRAIRLFVLGVGALFRRDALCDPADVGRAERERDELADATSTKPPQ